MNTASSPNFKEAEWNNWFVGFCDGEASFTFRCDRSTRCARPRFNLCLQKDADLIQAVFTRFNFIGSAPGEFTPNARRAGCGTIFAARAEWAVNSISGCLVLVEFFRTYPLRSHKRADFAIWSELVTAAASKTPDRVTMNLIAWRLSENRTSGNSGKAKATLKKWIGLP